MRSARARWVGAALIPLLMSATACKFGSDDTKDAKADPAAASASATAAGSGGKTLSVDRLKAVVLSRKELPSGWTVRPEEPRPVEAAKVTPAGCQPVWDLIFGDTQRQAGTEADATVEAVGGKSRYSLAVADFAPGVAEKLVSDAAAAAKSDATTNCLAYSATTRSGETIDVEGGNLDASKLGDASIKLLVTYGPKADMADPSNANPSGYVEIVRVDTALVGVFVVSDPSAGMFPQDFPGDLLKAQVDKLTAAKKG